MSKRSGSAAVLRFGPCALALVLALLPGARAAEGRPEKGPFGLAKVWRFDLHLSAQEYARLQPSGGFGPPGFGPPGGPARPPQRPADRPADAPKRGCRTELPSARAGPTADGKPATALGIRY